MKMIELFNTAQEKKIWLLVLVFLAAAITCYSFFFDILIPNVPNSSYRFAVSGLFLLPVIMLAFGQTFIGGFLLHMISRSVNPKKSDFWRAVLIISVLTFIFSLTYAVFPFYGPFYYIVFVYGGPWYLLPVEVGITLGAIIVGVLLSRKLLDLPYKFALLGIPIIYLFITVAAS